MAGGWFVYDVCIVLFLFSFYFKKKDFILLFTEMKSVATVLFLATTTAKI